MIPANAGGGPTLFMNGDFETWDSTTDAGAWDENTPVNGAVNQESSTVHGGTYSARLSVVGNSGSIVMLTQPNFQVTNAVSYTFEVWVYDNVPSTYVEISIVSGSNGPITASSSGGDAASWRQLSATVTADGVAAGVTIEIFEVSVATASVYVDDATITPPVSEFPFQAVLFIGFPLVVIGLILVKRHSSK